MRNYRMIWMPLLLISVVMTGVWLSSTFDVQANTTKTGGVEMRFQTYDGKVRAPEFPQGLDWINVERPLTMADLKGKVVLLDFWTYGCINCMHIIPDLHQLEQEFGQALVVVGVHSAKFSNEANTRNIRDIVQRYRVDHPVVNDKDFAIWGAYSVRAWPTLIVIDPNGKVYGVHEGEGVYDALQPILTGMIAQFEASGQLDRRPLPLRPERWQAATNAPLAFPGKVLADAQGQRLFISDSQHNRVIVADLNTYTIQAVIGGGTAGMTDGAYAAATFNGPQGLALDGQTLYVADTNNHAIRVVDLTAQTVSTIAGTGQQMPFGSKGGNAATSLLNSPWDVVMLSGKLYIAMAGSHQLWVYDSSTATVQPFAGSGWEGLEDGVLSQAQLAQPSGLATDGKVLYFADAEASAIRLADPANGVLTLVGTGLFDFGDADGAGTAARLQHALGITFDPQGLLYIADTYNSKIKSIDPKTRQVHTLFGGQGNADGDQPLFNEPGGLSYANGKLYIADTNNHAIRVADLQAKTVSTITFPNPELLGSLSTPISDGTTAPTAAATPSVTALETPDPDFVSEIIQTAPLEAKPGQGEIVLNFILPNGYKVNDQAPFTLHVYNSTPVLSIAPADNDLRIIAPVLPVRVPVTLYEGQATITLDATLVYCEKVDTSLCYFGTFRFEIPLTVTPAAADGRLEVEHTIVLPTQQ